MMHRLVYHQNQLSVDVLKDVIKMSAPVGKGLYCIYNRDVIGVAKPLLLGPLCEI
jgi:hypothetical protein